MARIDCRTARLRNLCVCMLALPFGFSLINLIALEVCQEMSLDIFIFCRAK